MGGEAYVVTLKGDADIKKVWADCQEEDGRRYGDDPYNGSSSTFAAGLDIRQNIFPSYNDAEEYILEEHQKWSRAIAVQYRVGNRVKWAIGGWAAI